MEQDIIGTLMAVKPTDEKLKIHTISLIDGSMVHILLLMWFISNKLKCVSFYSLYPIKFNIINDYS